MARYICIEIFRDEVSRLFVCARGAGVSGALSGSIHGLEGSQSLRRASSIRRTFTAVKRKNVCLQVKFTVVSLRILLVQRERREEKLLTSFFQNL